MAGFKLLVSDPETGKTFQKEFGVDVLGKIKGRKLGEEIDGGVVGLPGYKLMITGGSDKSGFPMRLGMHGSGRINALLSGGVGYKPKDNARRRKKVRGERVDTDIVQLNTKVSVRSQRPLAELLGTEEGDAKDGDTPTESGGEKPRPEVKAEEKKEAPAEKPPEEKPEEKKKEDTPKEAE